MSTPPPPTSLQQLKAEFDPWRQSKPAPQSRIPLGLGQQAAALRVQYSNRDITRLLSITAARLLKWAGEASSHKLAAASTAIPQGFIAVTLPSAPDAEVSPGVAHDRNTNCQYGGHRLSTGTGLLDRHTKRHQMVGDFGAVFICAGFTWKIHVT